MEGTIKTHFLDTSAILKLVVDEDGCQRVRDYFSENSVFWTTSFCFFETLGVLKAMCFYRKNINQTKYLIASEEMVSLFRNESISIEEVNIQEYLIFNETEHISKKYSLDIADAFQIVTLKKGFPSRLEGGAKTIFITCDTKLANIARIEGLRVWNAMKEEKPIV